MSLLVRATELSGKRHVESNSMARSWLLRLAIASIIPAIRKDRSYTQPILQDATSSERKLQSRPSSDSPISSRSRRAAGFFRIAHNKASQQLPGRDSLQGASSLSSRRPVLLAIASPNAAMASLSVAQGYTHYSYRRLRLEATARHTGASDPLLSHTCCPASLRMLHLGVLIMAATAGEQLS